MRRRFLFALTGVVLLACTEFTAPGSVVSFLVTPVFGRNAAFADDADRLKITIEREGEGGFAKAAELFVNIDPVTGEADTAISVLMLVSPTRFRIRLEAVRSADGVVLFAGVDTVLVSAANTASGAPVEIPVSYVGPTAARVVLSPSDTAVEAGSSFTFRAATLDAGGNAVGAPVRFYLINPADSTRLTVERLTGRVTVAAGVEGEARVRAVTPDGVAADTARVLIGAVPVAVEVDPGYGNVAAGGTVQLTGAVVDALGNPLTIFPVQWTSRSPAVASVNDTGIVTGVSPGTAVIFAAATDFASPAFTDSALVTVPAAGNVVVSTTVRDRGFESVAVGDTVVLDVTADMRFTPSEVLGSYNATLTWNADLLSFVDLQAGDFPAPEVNTTNTGSGELRFAQANASGTGGSPILARVRFVARTPSTSQPALTISEMSAALTYTNLIDRVTVTLGTVTIR